LRFAGDQTFASRVAEETDRLLRLVDAADVGNRHTVGAGIERLLDARRVASAAILLDRRDADDERLAARGAGSSAIRPRSP
jgi:hypothetical protein